MGLRAEARAMPRNDVASIVAPQDVGASIPVVIADVGDPPLRDNSLRQGNGFVAVQAVRKPQFNIAGCIIFPQHVGSSVSVEVSDTNDLPGAGRTVRSDVATLGFDGYRRCDKPMIDSAVDLVPPDNVADPVVVDVADARDRPAAVGSDGGLRDDLDRQPIAGKT